MTLDIQLLTLFPFCCIYHEALCVLSFSFGHSFNFIVVPGGQKLRMLLEHH